jgi:hypothetical protein
MVRDFIISTWIGDQRFGLGFREQCSKDVSDFTILEKLRRTPFMAVSYQIIHIRNENIDITA